MSDEEQLAAVGRIVNEYQQCKARLAALISEAGKYAGALNAIASRIESPASDSPVLHGPTRGEPVQQQSYRKPGRAIPRS
jgi:hypothetical protein